MYLVYTKSPGPGAMHFTILEAALFLIITRFLFYLLKIKRQRRRCLKELMHFLYIITRAPPWHQSPWPRGPRTSKFRKRHWLNRCPNKSEIWVTYCKSKIGVRGLSLFTYNKDWMPQQLIFKEHFYLLLFINITVTIILLCLIQKYLFQDIKKALFCNAYIQPRTNKELYFGFLAKSFGITALFSSVFNAWTPPVPPRPTHLYSLKFTFHFWGQW